MSHILEMPRLTGAQTEARVVEWLCEEGQSVREGDELLRVATATLEMPLPSPVSGIVREILVDEGDAVQIGDALALLD